MWSLKKNNSFATVDGAHNINVIESIPNNLCFEGEKIIFAENQVTVESFSVLEFIKQFDVLEFIDKKTKSRAIYLRVDYHPDTSTFIDDLSEKANKAFKE